MYHEAIVHPAMVRARKRDKVLIIGGAEGGTLREVLKYKDVKRVVMVDIDQELVSLCRKHLSDIYGNPFEDNRVELNFGDGRTFIDNTLFEGSKWDVIIIDLNEAAENNPAQKLFTKEFYMLINDALSPKGIVSIQSEWINTQYNANLEATQREAFDGVLVMEVNIPSFLLSEALHLGAKNARCLKISENRINKILKEHKIKTRYYTVKLIGSREYFLRIY